MTAIKNTAGGGHGVPQIIAQSAVSSSVTGTLAETTLATIALPALQANSIVRITHDHTFTNNADTKTITARINGTSVGAYNIASNATSSMQRRLANRNSKSSQLVTPATAGTSFGSSTSGYLTATIDTSVPTTLTLTGTLANAADTITLESYIVEVLNP
ncbi:hypothetical protein B0G81_6825 [Paraburkholderia sp. BL6665CI2N2]|uniref:hypothetical protein n=1 Tax=Paraburkholderia sp. BL6665CI2N2 TaxID=1938806 RepID=UPI0010666C5B|nr:hypothetical protein [Paraburkholderia sp. BL6665CI2N2]TDY26315.1 hypothetical protein B0G81_6825 [Paraburkholderia sp. BL6665CI2N2]